MDFIKGIPITEERSNNIEQVPLNVPVFIGYLPEQLSYPPFIAQGIYRDFADKSSNAGHPTRFYITKAATGLTDRQYEINGTYYDIQPDPNTVYHLLSSVRLFFLNGGMMAYVVPVGSYGAPSGSPAVPGQRLVNTNVKLDDLLRGLDTSMSIPQTGMIVCPEAVLLSPEDHKLFTRAVLERCAAQRDRIAILDVPMAYTATPANEPDNNELQSFRDNAGDTNLDYGAAYYPYVCADHPPATQLNHTNLFGGNLARLAEILSKDVPDTRLHNILMDTTTGRSATDTARLHTQLTEASPLYQGIIEKIASIARIVPPSGMVAGVIATTDYEKGVWRPPATKTLHNITSTLVDLRYQETLQSLSEPGTKAINAIWHVGDTYSIYGAKTLEMNHPTLRFLASKRTLIMMEQSLRRGLEQFATWPVDENTRSEVRKRTNDFMMTLFKQMVFAGADPQKAYSVFCNFIKDAYVRDTDVLELNISAALIRPNEYAGFTIRQRVNQPG